MLLDCGKQENMHLGITTVFSSCGYKKLTIENVIMLLKN